MSWLKPPTVRQALLLAPSQPAELIGLKTQGDRLIEIEANPGLNAAFDLIGLTQLRNDPEFAGIDGSGLSVAVIDTGIDRNHPLLASNYVAGYDFIDDDDNPEDSQGHGCHVLGNSRGSR